MSRIKKCTKDSSFPVIIFRILPLFIFFLCVWLGCSPEANNHVAGQTGGTAAAGSNGGGAGGSGGAGGGAGGGAAGSGGSSGSSGGSAATGVSGEPQLCEPREEFLECYCKDGSKTGTQYCDLLGYLEPCSGCGAGSQENPVHEAAPEELCEDLRGDEDCVARTYKSEELPANLLVVVDRSGSMSCNPPPLQDSADCDNDAKPVDDTQPSKWQITVDALKEVMGQLDGTEASAGLMFFSNDDYCGVNSDLAMGGVPIELITQSPLGLISNALDVQEPKGGTPLVGATVLAYRHLHQEAGGECEEAPCGAEGNRFVVLITDGEDSCPEPKFDGAPCGPDSVPCTQYLLEEEVRKATGVNIRTFVIGAPGSEPARGFLSELAFQGNTPRRSGCSHDDPTGNTGDCHYDMTDTEDFAADLSAALLDISGAALGCEFPVPPVAGHEDVEDPEQVNINVQYTLSGEDPVCLHMMKTTEPCDESADGFQLARNPDGTFNLNKVVLCGEACKLVEDNPDDIKVDVVLGCKPIVLLE